MLSERTFPIADRIADELRRFKSANSDLCDDEINDLLSVLWWIVLESLLPPDDAGDERWLRNFVASFERKLEVVR